MYAGLIMLAADVADFKQVAETLGLLQTLDFVNFGGFRFLDPPHCNVTIE